MLQEVTVAWERQRLLLFIIYLDDQGNDADDQNTELKQVGIGHHVHHPPPMEWRRKQEEVQPPPEGGAPPTATGSAWVDYSILCRIWQDTGTDCHVGALPLLAMTGRGIDKKLKAGIIVNRKRALPVDGVPPKCYMK